MCIHLRKTYYKILCTLIRSMVGDQITQINNNLLLTLRQDTTTIDGKIAYAVKMTYFQSHK